MKNAYLLRFTNLSLLSTFLLIMLGLNSQSQNLTQEFIDNGYTLANLGSVSGVPTNYGGLTIRPEEPNTLYIGGAANLPSAALYAIDLVRDPETNQITGFSGTAALFANTPNIDGGVTFDENGTLLFTRYSQNELGQILPDNTFVSTNLTQFGVGSSVGSLGFVPPGFSGVGNLIFASYNGSNLYNVPYTIAPNGEYLLSTQTAAVSVATTAPGPEGIAYIPLGSAGFPNPSIMISSYSGGKVVVYDADENGLPVIATARDLVTGLSGAEGALIDPLTGDFLFSTFGGGNQVFLVSGFATLLDCAGVINGNNSLDECGVCDDNPDNDNESCTDCAGIINGDSTLDECGVCDNNPDNDNESCIDCAGVVNGNNTTDQCGVCDDNPNNDNESCTDCAGVLNGNSTVDQCGVCDDNPNNDNETCTDCAGVINGNSTTDECGVCDDNPNNDNETCADCEGVPNGSALQGTPCTIGGAEGTWNSNCQCILADEPAVATLLTLDCGGQVIQITGSAEVETGGGLATSGARTVYYFTLDGDGTSPSYQGGSWPYVIAPGGVIADDNAITANFSTNDEGVVLINGSPVYQFIGDSGPSDVNGAGLGGVWFYILPNGVLSADACPVIDGCTQPTACNFNPSATQDNGFCVFAEGPCEVCEGGQVVNYDADGDGVCDADEVPGCTNQTACNFNADATDEDGSCVFAEGPCEVCENGGVVNNDADGDGVCDDDEVPGCTDMMACNFNASATDDDGSCILNGSICTTEQGEAGTIVDCNCVPVLIEIPGCTLMAACNFNPEANVNDGSCVFATGACEVCEGGAVVNNDADGDGVCDADEVPGCTDQTACNFNADATDEDDSCVFATGACEVCEGGAVVNNDADGDGVCDDDEVPGCTDMNACNFNEEATDDDGSCVLNGSACELTDGSTGTLVDCLCQPDVTVIPGCTNMMACNFNPEANEDDGNCILNGTACELEDGSTGTLVDCVCTPIEPGTCQDFRYFLADILADGTTNIYDVALSGTDAALTLIATSEVEVHIAYNETDKLIYAVSKADGSYRTLDPATAAWGPVTMINATVAEIIGAAINADGKLLISSQSANTIYDVDLTTQNVSVFDSYSPTLGGDIAFGSDGALYLATREGNGTLYLAMPDELMSDILLGSVPNLVTGIANMSTNQLILSSRDANTLVVRNYDGSAAADYNLTLDGEPFTAFNGDMASGCADDNTVIDECGYALYMIHSPQSGPSSLRSVTLNNDGTATTSMLLNNTSGHIGLTPDGATIYIVNGNTLRTYDVATNSIVNTLSILNASGASIGSAPAVVVGSDGTLYVGAGNKVYTVDVNTGLATQFGPNRNVNGGDLIFAPTGPAGAEELWIITRNNDRLTNVLTGAQVTLPATEINGAAMLENGNLLVADGNGAGLLKEIDLSDFSIVGTYETGLALFNGDLAGGCTTGLGDPDADGDDDAPESPVAAQVDNQSSLTSWPNPTNGPSQVVFVPAQTGRTLVEVYDMNGRNVASLFNQEAQAGQEYRVDFNSSSLPNGIYIYRMTTSNEIIIQKFLIAK
jgi:WD40 repeat protein/predicted lipoprotein with Yx(FWY)xxD motif